MSWWKELLLIRGHTADSAIVTLALSPLVYLLGLKWWLPMVGVLYAIVHEGVQWEWDWEDIPHFLGGGVFASLWIWLLTWKEFWVG